jgi:hypothetical protein
MRKLIVFLLSLKRASFVRLLYFEHANEEEAMMCGYVRVPVDRRQRWKSEWDLAPPAKRLPGFDQHLNRLSYDVALQMIAARASVENIECCFSSLLLG